jgi:hypothetical protein
MVSTCNDYKRSGQKLFPRPEQSRSPRIAGEHYGEDEEEDPKVSLDQLEQSFSMLTSMVSQLSTTKCKETPSTEVCHEGHKKEENKSEIEHKTELEMGECIYSKTQVPFHVEAKVEINLYTKKVYAIRLNQWLLQMEVYFSVQEVTRKQKIYFARLKLEDHALA